jgi:hypothetical protein
MYQRAGLFLHWLFNSILMPLIPFPRFPLLCHRFGRPKGDRHLLQRNELHSMFGPTQGFQVIKDDVTVISDGRELSEFIARKL